MPSRCQRTCPDGISFNDERCTQSLGEILWERFWHLYCRVAPPARAGNDAYSIPRCLGCGDDFRQRRYANGGVGKPSSRGEIMNSTPGLALYGEAIKARYSEVIDAAVLQLLWCHDPGADHPNWHIYPFSHGLIVA